MTARREFIAIVAGSVCGVLGRPAAAQPKPVDRTIRVAFVLSTSPLAEMLGREPAHPAVLSLLEEFRKWGYVEGRNLIFERRSAEGRRERYEPIFTELVALKCDVIIVITAALAQAAKKVTAAIPIVFVAGGSSDPVAVGLVQSLARPGGNATGVVPDAGAEIYGKRLELLKQMAPTVRRVAYVALVSEWEAEGAKSARAAAQALGVELVHVAVDPKHYRTALETIVRERVEAILTSSHPIHYAHRADLAAFALRHRLPNIHAFLGVARDGGLAAYAAESFWPRVVSMVDRIVKGARPAEIPVERPTRFELTINRKTAKAIGLAIPQDVLLRADIVIE